MSKTKITKLLGYLLLMLPGQLKIFAVFTGKFNGAMYYEQATKSL